ncbi:hypothetical protein D6745_03945 [Candidatus Woesearchaeota archaeon]|nr:MAG: hypothetical protein D6745_03945 [Candidatus Woesearchaeota archaeon]
MQITPDCLQGTFSDLAFHLLEQPLEKKYSGEQLKKARLLRELFCHNDPYCTEISFFSYLDHNNDFTGPFFMEDSIADNLDRIVRKTTGNSCGYDTNNRIDLIIFFREMF